MSLHIHLRENPSNDSAAGNRRHPRASRLGRSRIQVLTAAIHPNSREAFEISQRLDVVKELIALNGPLIIEAVAGHQAQE